MKLKMDNTISLMKGSPTSRHSDLLAILWPYLLIFVCGLTGYAIYGKQPFLLLVLANGVGWGWGWIAARCWYKSDR